MCLSAQADRVWEEQLRVDDSPVTDLFGGQLQTNVSCHGCKTRFTRYEFFKVCNSIGAPPLFPPGMTYWRVVTVKELHCQIRYAFGFIVRLDMHLASTREGHSGTVNAMRCNGAACISQSCIRFRTVFPIGASL